MDWESAQPPENLRPAQLGIVLLGRVILGHIGATLADLGQRGLIRIDEVPGDDRQDWLLTDERGQAASPDAPLPFEATLLDGLFAGRAAVRLSEVNESLVPTLNRVRAQLRRGAVRLGLLRRWHRGDPAPRTRRGEQLLTRIHSFRQELRALAASGDAEAMARFAPYMIMFGIAEPSAARLDEPSLTGRGTAAKRNAEFSETKSGWPSAARFTTGWLAVCATFPAGPRGHGHQSPDGQQGDFVHQWSAPRDHGQAGHSDGHSHGGDGGGHGYGGHGYGGHGGGVAGGGHAGH
jgi:hypothetical protein